ncbi:hypothetical protein [Halobacillus sp. BBL2006]|uniref:hypothetical protein n=1 Tax=Halobacillus sp. BBL2006 TaxID=1543706 RepID=UPI000542BD92|nr:hypothetical protein [Halobacillus sp. BBL2006]KHE72883.1 hypothetical protein LD39_02200 [Halobacillus sp. BBL2006]
MLSGEEVKKLRWKQWLIMNVGIAVLLIGMEFYFRQGLSPRMMLFIIVLLLLTLACIQFYQWKTGKAVGLKTTRSIQKYEREKLGEKQWNRQMKIGFITLFVLSVLFMIFGFAFDFSSLINNYESSPFNFVGAAVGVIIGFLLRIRKIDRSNKEDLQTFSRDMAIRSREGQRFSWC